MSASISKWAVTGMTGSQIPTDQRRKAKLVSMSFHGSLMRRWEVDIPYPEVAGTPLQTLP